MKTKNSKGGISLVVLVITIIVMIILASTIILNLSGVNIIERANEAIRENNRQQIETLAQAIAAKGYAVNKTEASIKETIVKELGKDKADDFNIVVTSKGVVVENFPKGWEKSVSEVINGVPIPKGFVVSPYRGENAVEEGLVIYALTEDEIDEGIYDITKKDEDKQYSLENRNQFVWVPVDRTTFSTEKDTEFVRDRFGWDIDKYWLTTDRNDNFYSNKLGSNNAEDKYFWEVELNRTTNMPNATQNMNFMSSATLDEVQKMYSSVKKYGGFYIARYEVGATNVDDTTKFGRSEDKTISVTMGKYPYNGVKWATSNTMNLDEGGAVQLAREFYAETNTNYGVTSTLTYGVQWDRTVAWVKSVKGESLDLLNSTEYGNYANTTLVVTDFNENAQYVSATYNKDSAATGYYDVGTWTDATNFTSRSVNYIMTTGALQKANVCNIYDMAGNMYEWTMEGHSRSHRVRRGGYFGARGFIDSVASRGGDVPDFCYADVGFRPSLYIK